MKLSMIRGDTRAFTMTLYDDDGNPIDLETGIDGITFTAQRNAWPSDTDIVKTLGDGIELQEEEEGEDPPDVTGGIVVTLDPADTNDLHIPHYFRSWTFVWDVQLLTTDEAIRTRRRGTLVVYADVTVPAPS